MHRGCEQEYERLLTLLSDSYNYFSRITYIGSVMTSLAVFLNGFLVAAMYHQARLFAE